MNQTHGYGQAGTRATGQPLHSPLGLLTHTLNNASIGGGMGSTFQHLGSEINFCVNRICP